MKMYTFPSNNDFSLLVENDLRWAEYDEDNKIFEKSSPGITVLVLDSVKKAFDEIFGPDYVSRFPVAILPDDEGPSSYRRQRIVCLSARGLRWSQFAYQFAHELCHCMIPADVVSHMRWFEESICELSSLFFLRGLSETWMVNPPQPNWNDYAPSFLKYRENRIQKVSNLLGDKSFGDFFMEYLPTLTLDCYKRDINTLCASHLLPVFEESPELWRDVPNLCKISTEVTFFESLECWRDLSSCKKEINKIITLFSHN